MISPPLIDPRPFWGDSGLPQLLRIARESLRTLLADPAAGRVLLIIWAALVAAGLIAIGVVLAVDRWRSRKSMHYTSRLPAARAEKCMHTEGNVHD